MINFRFELMVMSKTEAFREQCLCVRAAPRAGQQQGKSGKAAWDLEVHSRLRAISGF